jgi:hypothetical protein
LPAFGQLPPVKYKVSPDGYPILSQFSEEGFIDTFFKIVERFDNDEAYGMRLLASHDGAAVGMNVWVRRGIRGGFDPDTNLIAKHVYREGVRFRRTGPESDRLVAALAQLYEMPATSVRMVEQLAFTGIALHEDGQIDIEVQPIKIKLFGYDGPEAPSDLYFESFFNLDLANGFVYWNEKDQDYRAPLIRGLSLPQRG